MLDLITNRAPLNPSGGLWPCNSLQSWDIHGQIKQGLSSPMSWGDPWNNFSQPNLSYLVRVQSLTSCEPYGRGLTPSSAVPFTILFQLHDVDN